ncbi:hypothetical protein RR46_14196 [Papilio xuthus]|uniref:Transposase n=1 Tax=Papilio xuthus TaxID=66420 RepID=A0A194PPB4_PAPXU|nr:hypothetical protein RR46_14196 [Papilio xuthus]
MWESPPNRYIVEPTTTVRRTGRLAHAYCAVNGSRPCSAAQLHRRIENLHRVSKTRFGEELLAGNAMCSKIINVSANTLASRRRSRRRTGPGVGR